MIKIAEDEIKSITKRVLSMTFVEAERNNASDNPYFIAWEILDLTEWFCENHSTSHSVFKEILKSDQISDQTKQIIRKLS